MRADIRFRSWWGVYFTDVSTQLVVLGKHLIAINFLALVKFDEIGRIGREKHLQYKIYPLCESFRGQQEVGTSRNVWYNLRIPYIHMASLIQVSGSCCALVNGSPVGRTFHMNYMQTDAT